MTKEIISLKTFILTLVFILLSLNVFAAQEYSLIEGEV